MSDVDKLAAELEDGVNSAKKIVQRSGDKFLYKVVAFGLILWGGNTGFQVLDYFEESKSSVTPEVMQEIKNSTVATQNSVAILASSLGAHLVEADTVLSSLMETINDNKMEYDVNRLVDKAQVRIDDSEAVKKDIKIRTETRRDEGTLTAELEEMYNMSVMQIDRDIQNWNREIMHEKRKLENWN